MKYRKDIEGLRGIAVLLVIIYHYDKKFVISGYIGVDIFFFISGYVIGIIYVYNGNTYLQFTLNFYRNRIRRIIPVCYTVLFYVLKKENLFFQYNPIDIQSDVRYAIIGIANVRFINKEINYLYYSNPPSAILHFWSLSIEQQYYVLFPFLILINTPLLFLILVYLHFIL